MKLLAHFREAGAAVFAVKEVEYGRHDRTPLHGRDHAITALGVQDVIWITARRVSTGPRYQPFDDFADYQKRPGATFVDVTLDPLVHNRQARI